MSRPFLLADHLGDPCIGRLGAVGLGLAAVVVLFLAVKWATS